MLIKTTVKEVGKRQPSIYYGKCFPVVFEYKEGNKDKYQIKEATSWINLENKNYYKWRDIKEGQVVAVELDKKKKLVDADVAPVEL